MKFWLLLVALTGLAFGQPTPAESEEKELSKALAEAGNSQIDFIRALENHLVKYPDSAKKPEIERALVKASIEVKDDRRIILYGEWVLDHEAGDPQVLDRLTRALLASDAKDNSEREPSHLRFGIEYQALNKMFMKKVVVGDVTLNIYSGQITVLF